MTQVMNSPTTTDLPNFTPSLGLRYWMNRMKRANSTNTQDNNDKISTKSATAAVTTDGLYARSMNDTTSAVSISGTTTHSFFGVDSVHAYDIDSSLRVLHHHAGGCASSERSSFMSDDIQSNASIKSKPWVSQLLTTNDHHAVSTHSIDPSNLLLPHQRNTHLLVEQNGTYDEDDEDDEYDDDDDDIDEDDDNNNDDDYTGIDGNILSSTTTSSSYSAAHHGSLHSIRSAEDIQPSTIIHDDEDVYYSQQQQQQQQPQQQQQQQQQQQRRWSDHQYPPSPPRPLGRIKAGLGRLMGREHTTATIDQRDSLA